MQIGITGHQRLEDISTWDWVEAEIDRILSEQPRPLIGLTSLAVGADQLFANIILRLEGNFIAIVPFDGYEAKLEVEERNAYQHLLQRASRVTVLKNVTGREAYFRAGKLVVDLSDLMIAVWDGQPAAELGGTGDAVAYARQCGKPVIHINPITQTAL